MNPDEIRKDPEGYIRSHVSVSRQDIIVAKRYIVKHHKGVVSESISSYLGYVNASEPKKLDLGRGEDWSQELDRVVRYYSQGLAACQAIWELVHSNVLIRNSENQVGGLRPSIGFTTGGFSSSYKFDDFQILVPRTLCSAPSVSNRHADVLTDADLFLNQVGYTNLDPLIESALRDAVECYAMELYTPCVAMLGKASEGLWAELGTALSNGAKNSTAQDAVDLAISVQSPFVSVATKIDEVCKFYEDAAQCGDIVKASRVRPKQLNEVRNWSDIVRDSRNFVHFGATPLVVNTYEKVGCLLLAASHHVQTASTIVAAATP